MMAALLVAAPAPLVAQAKPDWAAFDKYVAKAAAEWRIPGSPSPRRRELPAEQEFRHQRRDTVAGNENEGPVRPGDTDDLGAPQLVPDPRL